MGISWEFGNMDRGSKMDSHWDVTCSGMLPAAVSSNMAGNGTSLNQIWRFIAENNNHIVILVFMIDDSWYSIQGSDIGIPIIRANQSSDINVNELSMNIYILY